MGKFFNMLMLSSLLSLTFLSNSAVAQEAATSSVQKSTESATKIASNSSGIRTSTPDGKPVWFSLNEGLAAAKATGKNVLVDVYTDWCGFCHKLDKEVFAVAPVAPYLAENFVCIRINAEDQAEGQAFARKSGVRAFPTSIFLNSKGDQISQFAGFKPAETYLQKLQQIQAISERNGSTQSVQ